MQFHSKNISTDPYQMSRFQNPKMSRLPGDKMSHGIKYLSGPYFFEKRLSQELSLSSREGAKQ